ncbi:tetratricopeptide repeat protein [Phormidium nigroviride]
MTDLNKNTASELDLAIVDYVTALNEFEQEAPKSEGKTLNLLLARDAVAVALNSLTQSSATTIASLLQLDERLKTQAGAIAEAGKLEDWRSSLNPPESSWWWFFQPAKQVHSWDRFDDLWNGLSVLCITAFAAYMTSLVPKFAVGGFGLLESFGIIGPSGLMALALSSLQGGGGEKVIKNMMNKARIPSHLQSEVTLGIAATLLLGAIVTQANLPKIANSYYEKGREYYDRGLLTNAEEKYKQALSLDPDDDKISIALGEIYESVGDIEQAQKMYKGSLENGTTLGFNHLGRIYRQQGKFTTAEALFRMGLQRSNDDLIKFQLHRNLGWVLLDQKQYGKAALELESAIALDKKINKRRIGGGMANCLLAKVREIQKNKQREQREWEHCKKFARPETLNEYKWLVESGPKDIASTVDTSSVVAGKETLLIPPATPPVTPPVTPNVTSPSPKPNTTKPTP